MGSETRRFSDRAKNEGDDGADFETFVFECFRSARQEHGFTKRVARGRDGAVDLIDWISAGKNTIAECKFIGSNLGKDATTRWNEVFQNLNKNLIELSGDNTKRKTSPYRAWLDMERPVTEYRFCVSTPMTPVEIRQLEQRIASDFAKLVAAGISSLQALSVAGAVRIFSWDWFDAELEQHPSICFRWFRGLPVGVDIFCHDDGEEGTFRDFLTGNQLPYFSRDKFEAEIAGGNESGEARLVTDLLDKSAQALLITGPGGVGKTRLSRELASSLTQEYGFDGYWLGRSAGHLSIEKLVARYPRHAAILLLVDYAEAAPKLSEIADAVAHFSANSRHDIRLIATCRASATNRVSDNLSVLVTKTKALASTQGRDKDYVRWVTHSILSLADFPQREALEHVCHGIPALAAFALFLFRRDAATFDQQFGALHGIADFDNWIDHRIASLIARASGFNSIEKDLAKVALRLPLIHERFFAVTEARAALQDALIADRWIELEGECYVAAHDVLADALIARWLFETSQASTARAIGLLVDAAENDDLSHALIVLARLAAHPLFNTMDGVAIVNALLAQHPELVADNCEILLEGPLLSLGDKLNLLEISEPIRKKIKDELALHIILALLAAELTHFESSDQVAPSSAVLCDLLDHACNQPLFSNLILRRAYALDQERFRDRVYANLASFPIAEKTQFVLAEMLRSGEAIDLMRPAVTRWLAINCRSPAASFVYRAWLDAGGDTDSISESLLAWISTHGRTLNALFVYRPWLSAGGDIEVIRHNLIDWIEAHEKDWEASFAYTAWLDAGGEIDVVSNGALAWIAAYGEGSNASHLYRAWLSADGAVNAIQDAVLSWIAVHSREWEASHVFGAWLNAGCEPETISHALGIWLTTHNHVLNTSHMLRAWLSHGGAPQFISDAIGKWVEVHGQAVEAQHVYSSWLSAGGEINEVSDAILAWIKIHGTSLDAQFIYRNWVSAGGEVDAIKEYMFQWAVEWHETEQFAFLNKILSKMINLPEKIILFISTWSSMFPNNIDSINRISTLIGHLRKDSLSSNGIYILNRDIFKSICKRDILIEIDPPILWSICYRIGKSYIFNIDPFGVVRISSEIIRIGLVFNKDLKEGDLLFLSSSQDAICQLALYGLRYGELDLERDFVALSQFGEWIKVSAENKGEARRILRRLDTEFPSHIWR